MKPETYLIEIMERIIQEVYSEIKESDENISITKVMPLLLFRKIIEKVDAINILYEHKSGEPALSLSRGVIENYWYFMFMIDKDTDFRALSYYYYDKRNSATKKLREIDYYIGEFKKYKMLGKKDMEFLENQNIFFESRKELNLLRRAVAEKAVKEKTKNTSEKLRRIIDGYSEHIHDYEERIKINNEKIDKMKKMILQYEKRIDELYNLKKGCQNTIQRLKQDFQFKEVREEIRKAKKKYADFKISWYTLKTGLSSIRKVSQYLEFNDEYTPYSSLSQEVHSSNATSQVSVDEGKSILLDLRSEVGSETALLSATTFLSYAIKPFLTFYDKDIYYQEISERMNQYINK